MTAPNLRDFLNWFEGISENIEDGKAPTPSQWAKIRDRLLALKESPETASAPALAPPPPPPPAPSRPVLVAANPEVDSDPRGTTVVAKWRSTVKKFLEDDHGMDGESALEYMADKRFVVDLNVQPQVMAARVAGGSY